MPVTLGADVLHQYERFTRYNSPYAAHERGCAIDLYPDGETALSPVSGEVIDVRQVRAPPQPYAAEHDYLVLVDTDEYVARILHVDPIVEPGDSVAIGDNLGTLIRAGFFAPWVPNHIHLGFRSRDVDPYRAAGSEPIDLAVDVKPLSWDGSGTVVEIGDTWARLDAPAHPDPGSYFVGLGDGGAVLDGGFPHYDGGGRVGAEEGPSRPVEIAGVRVGTAAGQHVTWDECTVHIWGQTATGIALYCGRDSFGVRLVGEKLELSVGERVRVDIECSA
jgi:hypothetical protein